MCKLSRITPGSSQTFFRLLETLQPRIIKNDTFRREALSPCGRLALAQGFFTTGDSYMSMSYSWLVAHNAISKIIEEVAKAIIAEYSEDLLSPPVPSEKWKEVTATFENRWSFPHAIGAIDGKHVATRCPKKCVSLYYNYKGFYSIIMLAVVDGDYKFLWVDAGSNRVCSEA